MVANIGIVPTSKNFGSILVGDTSAKQEFVISNTTSPVESVGIDSIAIDATAPFLAKFADEPDSAYRKSIESFVLSSGTTGLIDSPAVKFDNTRTHTEKTLCALSATIAVDLFQVVAIDPARTLRVSVFEYHGDTHTVTILKNITIASISNTINSVIIKRASATNFILAVAYTDLGSGIDKRKIYLVKYDNATGTEVIQSLDEDAASFQDYGCCSSFTGSTLILQEQTFGEITSYLCDPVFGISRVSNIAKGPPVVPAAGAETAAHLNAVASGILLYSFYGSDIGNIRGSVIGIDESTGALTWTDNYKQINHTIVAPSAIEVSSQAISDENAVLFFCDSDGAGTYSQYAVYLAFDSAGINTVGAKQTVITLSLNRPGVRSNTKERSSRSYAGYVSAGMVLNMSIIDVLGDGTISVVETLAKPFAVPASAFSIELLQSIIFLWTYRASAPPNDGYVYAQRLDSAGDTSKTIDIVASPVAVGLFSEDVSIVSRSGAAIETDTISLSCRGSTLYPSGTYGNCFRPERPISPIMYRDM